jgi:hypothetical protein
MEGGRMTKSVFAQRLARVLESYRLARSEYYAPTLAPDGNRLKTADEWAHEIEDRLFLTDSVSDSMSSADPPSVSHE